MGSFACRDKNCPSLYPIIEISLRTGFFPDKGKGIGPEEHKETEVFGMKGGINHRIYINMLRGMSLEKKLSMAFELSVFQRDLYLQTQGKSWIGKEVETEYLTRIWQERKHFFFQRLKRILTILQGFGVPYLLTGSLVTSLQGQPRPTENMDFLLVLSREEIPQFLAAFPQEEFELEKMELEKAVLLKKRLLFTVRDGGEGIHFWLSSNSPFDESRCSRGYLEDLYGIPVMISSPEDTILMKLYWITLFGESEKHFFDALQVYAVQKPILTQDYLDRWVKQLGLEVQYSRLLEESWMP